MKTFNSVSMSEGMKKYVRFFIACVCAILAFPLAAQAQIQNGDMVTIRSNGYYLAVAKENNGNYKLQAISIEKPTRECFWTVTVQNNQYSFVNVVASEAGRNAWLYRNNTSLTLAAVANRSAFQFGNSGFVNDVSNETTGRLYYKTGNQYYYIRYQSRTNRDGSWNLLSKWNAPDATDNGTLLTLEKWEYKEEAGGLVGAFNSPAMHFELATDEDENEDGISDDAADQVVTFQFTVTRNPARQYYTCLPRQGETNSTIELETSTSTKAIELESMSFTWESNKNSSAILSAKAGTYDNPDATSTPRECLKVTSEEVTDAATPTYKVTLTPIGSSPMNMKDDAGKWIDLTDNLVATFREKDDPIDTKYETKLFILRHSYHKVQLPAFVITPTPMSYTFGRLKATTTNITFECTHQHGYEVYSPANKLVHTERTLHEQLTLGDAIDREHKTAKAEFSFQNQQDLTAVDWVGQTAGISFANNTLSITAQENKTGMNRQARLVCKVSYDCYDNKRYEGDVTIQLRQRAKDGAITLQPHHGYANHVFGKNPYNQTDEQQVHTAEQIIYYEPGDEIDLILPEAQFMGYKRWYDYETGANPVWNLNESDRTTWHVAPAGTNINNSYGDSHGIYSTTNTNTNNPTLYGWKDGEAHIMACDVSNYKDYEIHYDEDGDISTIVEPTLSYRQLWHLRPASEMADKFAALGENEYLETHYYTAPTHKNIFLVPDYGHNREVLSQNNYFYYADADKKKIQRIKGEAKWYDETGDITPRTYNAKDFLSLESNTTGTKTYYLRAPGVLPNKGDLLIAKFVVTFVDINTHGPIAPSSKTDALITRKQITEEYILLEEITFNYDPLPKGTAYEPIYHPLPWGESTYGYFYSNGLLGGEDKYHQHDNRKRNPSIPYYGEYFLTNTMSADWAEGTQHGGAQNGYALFVDGTTEPGLVASISTDAKICSGQTMYCTMWLLNPRKSEDGSANPIFRCNIQGRKKDENGVWGEWEEVGVFFVGPVQGAGRGWHQIKFPVLSEEQSYEETRVSIYNFGMGNNGNDFMVDDICLYASPLPLAAYQATMGCESFTDAANTSTAVVVRMDYKELNIYSTEDISNEEQKFAYYQIYNNTDKCPIHLTAPVKENNTITYQPAYYNENPKIVSNNEYGSVAIPIPKYEPTTEKGDDIQESVRGFIDDLIKNSKRHGKCFVYDRVTGKYFLYVIHIIPSVDHHSNVGYEEHIKNSHLEKDKSYELRIAHAPTELEQRPGEDIILPCASTTPLHATQDTYVKLNTEGEEPIRVECMDNKVCANDFHMLEVKVQNTFATSVGGSLQTVEANVHADWLWGYEFDNVFCDHLTMTPKEEEAANAAFAEKYGCSRADLRAAIAAMRRVPTDENPNPNYQVDNYRDLQVVTNETTKVVEFSQPQIDLITRLCKAGLLSLYKTHEMFYLGSNDIARYWVYPVADDANVVINGETYTLHDCDEPKWVKVQSEASEYGVNISPEDFEKTTPMHLQLPTVRIVQPTADDTEIEIPIKEIVGKTQLYSTLYSGTNLTIDLANPIHEVLEFVNIQYDRIEVAPAPTSWEVGEKYLMRMSFYDQDGHAYIGGIETNCRVGYVYFYVLIVPNTVRWTGAVSNEWGNDENWVGVADNGTDMEIGHAPLAGTNVIIPALSENIPYPSIGSNDCYPKDIYYAHNTCNDIYFAPGAMLHNQHLLDYKRAFVDMQLQANDWNAMSPPLQGMYTGDIYVPHSGTFSDKNGKSEEYTSPFVVNSFQGTRTTDAPYVFWQAIYNKRVKNQHANGNTSSPALTNEALFVQTNTLDYKLQPGTGFQVLAFGPRHQSTDDIIIRLPKPDNRYYYYKNDGTQSDQSVSVTHSSKLAFNPTNGVMTITLQNDLASNQFMFGNPTMANIDMAKFLARNNATLAQQYYTFSSSSWQAKSITSIKATGEPGTLAPMRSVMLQLNSGESKNITLTLSEDDLVAPGVQSDNSEQPAGIAPRQSLAAADDTPQAMTIYATSSNGQAQCMLLATPQAHNTYDAMEDVLFISTGVETSNILTTPINMYTVADQVPMMIDVRQDIDTIPLSMLVHDDYRTDTVEFAFYLTLNWDKECYFYDAFTDTRYRIMDGMFVSLPMPQNHENRYFILGPDDSSNGGIVSSTTQPTRPDEHAIHIWAYAPNQGELIVCSNDIIQEVKVYDVAGRLIAHQVPQLQYNTLTIPCPAGVCIVEATTRDRTQHYTRTIVK